MTRYRYAGPLTSVTLRGDAGDAGRSITLHHGALVSLPADHPYVVSLVARGLLVEVEEIAIALVTDGRIRKPRSPKSNSERIN